MGGDTRAAPEALGQEVRVQQAVGWRDGRDGERLSLRGTHQIWQPGVIGTLVRVGAVATEIVGSSGRKDPMTLLVRGAPKGARPAHSSRVCLRGAPSLCRTAIRCGEAATVAEGRHGCPCKWESVCAPLGRG